MIVLRLHLQGRTEDVQSTEPRLVLGSDPTADVVQTAVGWSPREAVLVHRGTEVELQREGDRENLRLRVGDSVRLGHARVDLIGLLPLPAAADAPESEGAGADLPAFGPYEEEEDPAPPPLPLPPRAFGIAGEPDAKPDTTPEAASPSPAPTHPLGPTPPPPTPPPPTPPPFTPPPPPRSPAPAAEPTSASPPLRKPPPSKAPPGRSPSGRSTSGRSTSGKATSGPASQGRPGARSNARPPASERSHARQAPPPAPPGDRGSGPDRPRTAAAAAHRGTPPLRRPPSPAFRTPDFGDELVRQIKRAPFFAVSFALHVFLFLILTLLQSTETPGSQDGRDGSLRAALREASERTNRADEEGEEIEEMREPELPTFPEDVRIPDPDVPDAEQMEEAERLEALPDDAPLPFTVGVNPTLSSATPGRGRARPKVAPAELKQAFSKGDAESTNQKAAELIRSDLGLGSGRRGSPLHSLRKADLLVVTGTFDKVGKVLTTLQLPYVIVRPTAMSHPKAPALSQHKVIFWNCGESLSPEKQEIVTKRLEKFVKKGGYLFTTDWAVSNVLLQAFPDYLGTSGPRAPLPETVIDIRPASGQGQNPLLKGVFHRGVEGRWWLERASFDMKILNERRVTALIESTELKEFYGRDATVAATFHYGRGRVLHVMGHYFQEEGNLAGTISAQRLALNFILERLAQD